MPSILTSDLKTLRTRIMRLANDKVEIVNLRNEIECIKQGCVLQGVSHMDVVSGKSSVRNTGTLHETLMKQQSLTRQYKRRLHELSLEVDMIEAALQILTPDEMKLVRVKYFNKQSVANTAKVLGVSVNTITKREIKLLHKVSSVMVDKEPIY